MRFENRSLGVALATLTRAVVEERWEGNPDCNSRVKVSAHGRMGDRHNPALDLDLQTASQLPYPFQMPPLLYGPQAFEPAIVVFRPTLSGGREFQP